MPLTEKKGRFLVHTECITPEAPASTEKRVKRGRFTVSTCLPCISGGRTSSVDSECTLLRDAVIAASTVTDDALLGSFGQPKAIISRALASQDSLTASTRDSTPCKDQQLCDTSSWGSSSDCSLNTQDSRTSYDEPSQAKTQRRVRFSEPEYSTPYLPSVQSVPSHHAAASRSTKSSMSWSSKLQQQPGSPVASPRSPCSKPITRSYCRGRFVVQEAVVVSSSLPRSLSVPEHSTLEAYLSPILEQQKAAQARLVGQAAAAVAAAATPGDSYWSTTSAATATEVSGLAGTLSDVSQEYGLLAASKSVDQQQHRAPKRSSTVSYFRRGR